MTRNMWGKTQWQGQWDNSKMWTKRLGLKDWPTLWLWGRNYLKQNVEYLLHCRMETALGWLPQYSIYRVFNWGACSINTPPIRLFIGGSLKQNHCNIKPNTAAMYRHDVNLQFIFFTVLRNILHYYYTFLRN